MTKDEWMVRVPLTADTKVGRPPYTPFKPDNWIPLSGEISWLLDLAVSLRGKGVHMEGLVRTEISSPMAFRIVSGELD